MMSSYNLRPSSLSLSSSAPLVSMPPSVAHHSLTLRNISNIDSFVLLPVWAFKMVLAVVASLLSAILVFPSFRYSELQFNVTTVTRSVVTRAVVRLCYLMPLFCLGLWIKPFAKDLFSEMDVITILGRGVPRDLPSLEHLVLLRTQSCSLQTPPPELPGAGLSQSGGPQEEDWEDLHSPTPQESLHHLFFLRRSGSPVHGSCCCRPVSLSSHARLVAIPTGEFNP